MWLPVEDTAAVKDMEEAVAAETGAAATRDGTAANGHRIGMQVTSGNKAMMSNRRLQNGMHGRGL